MCVVMGRHSVFVSPVVRYRLRANILLAFRIIRVSRLGFIRDKIAGSHCIPFSWNERMKISACSGRLALRTKAGFAVTAWL